MIRNCHSHPDTPAEGFCRVCKKDLCGLCEVLTGVHTFCEECFRAQKQKKLRSLQIGGGAALILFLSMVLWPSGEKEKSNDSAPDVETPPSAIVEPIEKDPVATDESDSPVTADEPHTPLPPATPNACSVLLTECKKAYQAHTPLKAQLDAGNSAKNAVLAKLLVRLAECTEALQAPDTQWHLWQYPKGDVQPNICTIKLKFFRQ